jgi:hypothetical protein
MAADLTPEPVDPDPGVAPRERQRGPVTLRRAQVPYKTTDQRLLDERGPSDWVHTDPWRVLRIQAEFVEGFGALAELGPAVSVFGSARTTPDAPEYALGSTSASGSSRRATRSSRAAARARWRRRTAAPSRREACRWASASSCRSSSG